MNKKKKASFNNSRALLGNDLEKYKKYIVTLDDCDGLTGQDIQDKYRILFGEKVGYEYFSRLFILDIILDNNNQKEALDYHEVISQMENLEVSKLEVQDKQHKLDYRKLLDDGRINSNLGYIDLLRWVRALGPSTSEKFVRELCRRNHPIYSLVNELHLKWLSIYRQGIIRASQNGYDELIRKLFDMPSISFMIYYFYKVIDEVKKYPVTNEQDEEEVNGLISDLQQGLNLLKKIKVGYSLQEDKSIGSVNKKDKHLGLSL